MRHRFLIASRFILAVVTLAGAVMFFLAADVRGETSSPPDVYYELSISVASNQETQGTLHDLARTGLDTESFDVRPREIRLLATSEEYRALQRQRKALSVRKTISGSLAEQGAQISLIDSSGVTGSYAASDALTVPIIDDGYHTSTQIEALLRQFAETFPNITALVPIGSSHQGRTIWALKISDNAGLEEDEPAILFNGQHHAREIITPEIVLDIILRLTTQYNIDAELTDWINRYEIWCVPVVNPDGNERVFGIDLNWRKNVRDNDGNGQINFSDGVDLNRNYPFYWGGWANGSSGTRSSSTYRGPSSGSEPEALAIMRLAEKERFVFSVSYHSTGEVVLYALSSNSFASPQNVLIQPAVPDQSMSRVIAREFASHIIRDNGTAGYGSSPALYPVDGVDRDWQYFSQGTIAFVVETTRSGLGFQPNYNTWRNPIVFGQRPGWAYLLQRMNGPAISGHVREAGSGKPVVAEIIIDEITHPSGEVRVSNPRFGYFHITAVPGDYTVTFRAPNYVEQTILVHVGNGPSDLNVELFPRPLAANTRELRWQVLFEDNFESDKGWTIDRLQDSDTATDGRWERADPAGTFQDTLGSLRFRAFAPEFDHSLLDGHMAYVTGNRTVSAPSGPSIQDLDGGFTSLYSPVFDARRWRSLNILFYRRFITDSTGNEDSFEVSLSNNGGSSFLILDTITTTNIEALGTGAFERVELVAKQSRSFVFSAQMQIRIRVRDALPDSNVEAAVDDVRVEGRDKIFSKVILVAKPLETK
ncbi:MAG: hypothetical protein HY587_05530 [Candidatus Omnitrophica bacterium]|nr:hypothetical protein [Candidatus Omnitrophota bacterium]